MKDGLVFAMVNAPLLRLLGYTPHALSMARVLLVAYTYVAAFQRDTATFAVLVLLAALTDIMDGPLARYFGTANRFGANVDSAADLMFYLSLPVWAWLFQPDIILAFLPLILVLSVLYLVANFVSHATFGALGVHNRLSRTSGTAGILMAFYVILWGLDGLVEKLLVGALVALMAADLAQRFGAVLRHRRGQRRAGDSA